MTMKVLGVIPARYGSTRFPGKVMADLGGKPILQWVYEAACEVRRLDELVIATDDTRVAEAARGFGAEVVMTSPDHVSGTDRIVEVVVHRQDVDVVVNLQGDEPFMPSESVDEAIGALESEPALKVSTLIHRIEDVDELLDPSVVKVVGDHRGNALYFSRSLIPYARDMERPDGDLDFEAMLDFTVYYRHIGLYVYRRDFLMEFASWTPSPLEMIEKLEQLRILQNGYPIRLIETEYPSMGIDTPEDLAMAKEIIENIKLEKEQEKVIS